VPVADSSAQRLVGRDVVLHVGTNALPAVVTEDRGPLGPHGARVYRVRVDFGEGETREFEVPETALELAGAS